ncbi:MAG: T9SS type A sorting domain-containing protein, partial [Pedobacter sp.]
CEYWQLYRSSGSSTNNASVTLKWNAASPCGPGGYVSSPLDIRVAQLVGTTWTNRGNTAVTGSAPAGTVTSATVPTFTTANSLFTLGSATAANTLPVVFGDVRAYEKNDGVQIDWSNLTEKDVALYTIERSANGRDFSAIGTQLPTSNRDDKASYSGFDATPVQGVNYYRIKAEETTGKIVYSKVLSVNLGNSNAGLRLYPNPVTGHQVTISMTDLKRGTYNLQVVNVSGQEIFKKAINNPTGNLTQTLDLPTTVKAGMYHLVVTGQDYREMKTFIIQ